MEKFASRHGKDHEADPSLREQDPSVRSGDKTMCLFGNKMIVYSFSCVVSLKLLCL
ncbi:hypothetical protein TIFTF001_030681 [Ficus carica]|uniref:Uncharacterized protein n=1 Tax=Ficus carica TaxID=3494 RepID=A0AA88DUA2_FICCA|nr:hypothetical protein TIFTF001_030681 [Ficus carica]